MPGKMKRCWAVGWFICACAAIAITPAPATAQATETVLHSFRSNLPRGGNPQSGVLRDAAGNLYGTSGYGGPRGGGVVYKVDPTGRETVLYAFTGGADGWGPSSAVIGDSAGNLYGTTSSGGVANAGVVYKLDPAG